MNESCAPALAAKRASEAAERATDVKERIVSGAWWYNSVRGMERRATWDEQGAEVDVRGAAPFYRL